MRPVRIFQRMKGKSIGTQQEGTGLPKLVPINHQQLVVATFIALQTPAELPNGLMLEVLFTQRVHFSGSNPLEAFAVTQFHASATLPDLGSDKRLGSYCRENKTGVTSFAFYYTC